MPTAVCPEATFPALPLHPESRLLLHELFARAVRLWPDNVAIDVPPSRSRPARRTISYAALDRRSDALAARLRERVREECVVAIFLPRDSEEVYLAQLAVLKAGAAYACIDPAFPDARIRHILDDARPVAMVADLEGEARLRGLGRNPALILHPAQPDGDPRPASWLSPRSLAYVIYTSGTTGWPKGVMIEHAGIVNLLQGDQETFPVSPLDRVGQNSSVAYDSSLEEIWMALASGATLVVMDDETTRLGPDLVDWLARERITIFSPPPTLLRATGCADPVARLPHLRRLHVGGEPMPDDIAARWSHGRQLLNDYGPTECSVVALRTVLHPGDPVSIGQPVPGTQAWVLDGDLNEVARGEEGELCLGGSGLARGYLNDPDSTARKFPVHPRLGRIYRTGDRASRDERGNFHCHGRLDTQVKVRGYRIELEAIETRLVECPGVREAVCRVQGEDGNRALVAFIVADGPVPPSPDALKEALRIVLPEYMVPARIGVLETLPRLVSGKLDRSRLPVLEAKRGDRVEPRTPIEAKVAEAFRRVLGLADPPCVSHDFFHELGGDSLRAAMAISLLRDDPGTAGLAVRDLYEARTAAGLASRVAPDRPQAGRPVRQEGRPILATAFQTAWLLAGLVAFAPVAYFLTFHFVPAVLGWLGLSGFVLVLPLLAGSGAGLYAVASVVFAVALKRLLIGRYRPRCEPVWGGFHVRNWIVASAVRMIPWGLMDETVFQNAVLRLLGARIGRRVHIHRGLGLLGGGWDLLEIGDDATLCRNVAVRVVDFQDGQILVAPVSIGAGCTLDIRSAIAGGARMEPGAFLTAHSALQSGAVVPQGECWAGVPAVPQGQTPPPPDLADAGSSPVRHGLAVVAGRILLGLSATFPFLLLALAMTWATGIEAVAAAGWLRYPSLDATALLLGAVAIILAVPASLVSSCLAMRVLGRVKPGVMSRWSREYIRVMLKADLLEGASAWLSATLMWPVWLRGAGMRIGPRSEFSTIFDTVPELTEVGADCFLADGIYLAGPRIHRGTVTLASTRLGDGVFLGNYSVVPIGAEVPASVLLGVCTVADGPRLRPGTSWFGHPPFELPKREVIAADAGVTHRPSWMRYLNRVFWELLRFALPLPSAVLLVVWLVLVGRCEASLPVLLLGVVPLLELGFLATLCLLGVALKWVLLGRVKPGTHPLWSCWCSRWDFNYTAWGFLAGGPVSALEGTLWINGYLRALGVKVGSRAIIVDALSLAVDPDMLECQDGATVDALFQAHTFEDRVLKIDRVRIGAKATVGHGALLLYGADVGDEASVAGNSVVMKHERLPAGHTYIGCPTRVVG